MKSPLNNSKSKHFYEVVFHYGDTGFEENLTGEIFASKKEAERVASNCDKHIDCEGYDLGDYYYVREVERWKSYEQNH